MKSSSTIWEEAQDETLSHIKEMNTGDWGEVLEMLSPREYSALTQLALEKDECWVGRLVLKALERYRDHWDKVNYNARSDEWDGE